MEFLLAPGTGPSRFWGFGVEIDRAPAVKKLSHVWEARGGTGKLAVIAHSVSTRGCRPDAWQQAALAGSSGKSLKMKDK